MSVDLTANAYQKINIFPERHRTNVYDTQYKNCYPLARIRIPVDPNRILEYWWRLPNVEGGDNACQEPRRYHTRAHARICVTPAAAFRSICCDARHSTSRENSHTIGTAVLDTFPYAALRYGVTRKTTTKVCRFVEPQTQSSRSYVTISLSRQVQLYTRYFEVL